MTTKSLEDLWEVALKSETSQPKGEFLIWLWLLRHKVGMWLAALYTVMLLALGWIFHLELASGVVVSLIGATVGLGHLVIRVTVNFQVLSSSRFGELKERLGLKSFLAGQLNTMKDYCRLGLSVSQFDIYLALFGAAVFAIAAFSLYL